MSALVGLGASSAVAEDTVKDAAERLPTAIERARAAGLPFTLEDVNQGRSVPTAEDNASDLVVRLGSELDKQAGGWADIAQLEKLAIRREFSLVKAGLKPYQTALNLTEQAASKPRADFGRDWDFGWKTNFSEYATMKQAARVLGVRSQVRAASGDVIGALADLEGIRHLARLVSDERNLVGVEVSMATYEVGEKSVERVAAIWSESDENLASLQKLIAAPIRLPSLTDAAKGDFYLGLASTRNFGPLRARNYREDLGRKFSENWDRSKLVREGLPQGQISQAILTRHIETWLSIWTLFASDEPASKLIPSLDALVQPDERAANPLSYPFELLHVLEPAVQAPAAEFDIEARSACNRALVAALRYRLSQGKMPESPTDIACREIDPWTGEVVRFRVQGDQIRVYSVGPDGKDDGGRTFVELPQSSALDFDISWARMKGDIVASFPPLTPRTNPVH